jgi:hypothetical protein
MTLAALMACNFSVLTVQGLAERYLQWAEMTSFNNPLHIPWRSPKWSLQFRASE